jgi:hypothetical protein
MKRVYIQPETEVVRLNTANDLLIEMDPDVSTDMQLDNKGNFDEEEADEYDNFFDE